MRNFVSKRKISAYKYAMGGKQSKSKYVINQETNLDESQYQSQFARLRRSFRKRKTNTRNETTNHSITENTRSGSVLVKYEEQKKLSKSLSLPNNYKPSKLRREYDFQEDHIQFGDDNFETEMFVKSMSLSNGTKIDQKPNNQPTPELNYCTPLPDTVYLPPKSSSNDIYIESHNKESLKSSKVMSAKPHQWRPFSSQKYRLDVERSHVAKHNVMLRTASHYPSKSTRKDKSKSKVTFKDSNDYLLIDGTERQNGNIFPVNKKQNSDVKMMLSVTKTNDKPHNHSWTKSSGIEKHESKRQNELLLSYTNNNNNNLYSYKMINISNERNLHNAKINYLDRSSNERTETRPNRATRHSLSHNRGDVLLRKDGRVKAFRHSSPPAAEEYVFVSYAQQDKISLRKTQSSTFYQEI